MIRPLRVFLAQHASEHRAFTRDWGLALGDRACLALAKTLKRLALTADRTWAGLDLGIDVRVMSRWPALRGRHGRMTSRVSPNSGMRTAHPDV